MVNTSQSFFPIRRVNDCNYSKSTTKCPGFRRRLLGTFKKRVAFAIIQNSVNLQPKDRKIRRQYPHAILQLNTQNNDFYRKMISCDEVPLLYERIRL